MADNCTCTAESWQTGKEAHVPSEAPLVLSPQLFYEGTNGFLVKSVYSVGI